MGSVVKFKLGSKRKVTYYEPIRRVFYLGQTILNVDVVKVDDARTKLLDLKHLGRMFALREEQAEIARSYRFGCTDFWRS